MPRVKNFSTSVTTITTRATDQLTRLPNSGLPLSGMPPAAYSMPTLTSARPIISTIRPVTSGGSAWRMRPMKKPRKKWKMPPMTMPVIKPAMPATPAPATAGIMIGMKAKLVPCTMGRRAPTGPNPMVCSRVAMPARNIDIWIM